MKQGFAGQIRIPSIFTVTALPANPVSNYVILTALSTNTAVGIIITFSSGSPTSSTATFLYPGESLKLRVQDASSISYKGVNTGDIFSYIGS